MTMERIIMGLLWGMMGSSAIMSHIYSIYLHNSEYFDVGGGELRKQVGLQKHHIVIILTGIVKGCTILLGVVIFAFQFH